MNARTKVAAVSWSVLILLALLVPVVPAAITAAPFEPAIGTDADVPTIPRAPAGAEATSEASYAAAQLRFFDADAPRIERHRRTEVAGRRAVELETTDRGERLLVWIVDVDDRGLVVMRRGESVPFASEGSLAIARSTVASLAP